MRSLVVFACLAAVSLDGAFAYGDGGAASARPRVLILPFSNGGGASMDYLALALPEILTDRLEGSTAFDVVVGEIPILPDDVIDLAGDPKRFSEEAFAVARAHGADLVVRGSFSGQVWAWKLDVEILEVGPDGFRTLGRGFASGDQTIGVQGRSGKTLRIVSLERIQSILFDAFSSAYADTGRVRPADGFVRLRAPICPDAFAFILHTRAVGRTRTLAWIGKDKSALARAEHAVRVSPSCLPARRLYALLLERSGKTAKARGQFEALLKDAPSDIRAIVALGRIELALGETASAKARLRQAVLLRPDDPMLHASLGLALSLEGERAEAITEYERAIALSPADVGLRKTIAELYGSEGRHDDAVASLRVVMTLNPDDKASAFRLGAELRNALDVTGSAAWYASASAVFDDPRFARFADGDTSGTPVWQLVEETDRLMQEVEAIRKEAQSAANDVVMEFSLRGKEACTSSAHLLASELIARHVVATEDFLRSEAALVERKRAGEWVALGYREESIAVSTHEAADVFRKDRTALRLQWDRSIVPIVAKAGCTASDASVGMAEVARRNGSRIVDPAPYRSRPSTSPIAPEIPDGAVRIVRFRIVNTEGLHTLVLTVDGTVMGEIPAGSERTFAQKAGHHVLCLLPADVECGAPRTLRHVYLHEGWTLAVHSSP